MVSVTITGIQEAHAANLRAIAAVKPEGGLGRAIQYATTAAHQYAVSITHVDTGALRASERMALFGTRGEIFLDPTARNPRGGERTAIYGVTEHERGGSHAFFRRTIDEAGERIGTTAVQMIKDAAQ